LTEENRTIAVTVNLEGETSAESIRELIEESLGIDLRDGIEQMSQERRRLESKLDTLELKIKASQTDYEEAQREIKRYQERVDVARKWLLEMGLRESKLDDIPF
jgi:outer membrane murein-binding lipoprotein Lpp